MNIFTEAIKNEEKKIIEELACYQDLANNVEMQDQKARQIEKILSAFADKINNPPFRLKKEIVRMLLNEVIVNPKDPDSKSRDVEINYCFSENIHITKLSLIG